MRIAALALLAACSSSSPPRSKDAVRAAPIDAAPVVVAETADAAVPVAEDECIPKDARLTGYANEALVMCADRCLAISPDGVIRDPDAPPEYPKVTIADPPSSVEVCTAADACKTLKPNALKQGHLVVDAAVDEAGARALIAVQDEQRLLPGIVELWDLAKARRLGHGSASHGDPGGVDLDVGFAGETIVSNAHGRGESTVTLFLVLKSGKLVEVEAVFDGRDGWAALPEGNVALYERGEVRVVVAAKGAKEQMRWAIPLCAD